MANPSSTKDLGRAAGRDDSKPYTVILGMGCVLRDGESARDLFGSFTIDFEALATPVLEIPQAPWWWVVTTIVVLCVPIQLVVLAESVLRAVKGIPRPADGETKTDAGV